MKLLRRHSSSPDAAAQIDNNKRQLIAFARFIGVAHNLSVGCALANSANVDVPFTDLNGSQEGSGYPCHLTEKRYLCLFDTRRG